MEDTYDSGVTNQKVISPVFNLPEFLVQTIEEFVYGLKHGVFDAHIASATSWLEHHHQPHQDLFDQQAYFSGYTEQDLAADASRSRESYGVGSGSRLAQKASPTLTETTPEWNTAEGSERKFEIVHVFGETEEATALREAVNDLIIKEKRFRCLQCGKDYHNRTKAQDHIYAEHFQDRVRTRFECTLCHLKFKERRSAMGHQRATSRGGKKKKG